MNSHSAVRRARRLAVAAVAVALVVAACGSASTTSPAPTPAGPPLTADQAVAKALAQDPRFAGIGPQDPDMIGQSAWYEVSPATVGWRVMITMGWGDCQAGCISRHTWTYDVDGSSSGGVRLVQESGDPLPDGSDPGDGPGDGVPGTPPVAIPADGGPWLTGRAVAGPVCPVVQNPPDPDCADRPVAGAVVMVLDATGGEVARTTTAADGTFLVGVPGGGSYTVEAGPVEGLLGVAPAVPVDVDDGGGAWATVTLTYDTGIR